MPSGKTHTKLNLIALPVLVFLLVSYGFTSWGFLLWFSGGFVAGTYLLSPDLDTHSSPYRSWGPLRILWYPYQAVMPHRSVLTHTFIIGDLIRVLYLLLVLSPFLYILNKNVLDGQLPMMMEQHKPELLTILLGIITASALHIMADVLNTKRKRLFHRKRRRR
ncbi:metal-binding protein [Ectobacillus panaciterrae]|uniref:metal-binding protein n=1 Tax=Ectobacillus panaciterrae TaxID=363872 RepID=UPI0004024FAE|nr:metal-binding protein [Ectobacillus panaciterrae]